MGKNSNAPNAKSNTSPGVAVLDELYSKYFQKSRAYLYTLLGLKRNNVYQPKQTYAYWEGSPEGVKLPKNAVFVQFALPEEGESINGNPLDKHAWDTYLNYTLLRNKHFHSLYVLEDDSLLFVFSLDWYEPDVINFRQGKYSQLSSLAKACVREYYGVGTSEWAYMESFLEPERHFETYALLLDEPEELLRSVGELCDPPDKVKETLTLKEKATRGMKKSDPPDIDTAPRENKSEALSSDA